MSRWLLIVAALFNGVFTPFQTGCNARLAKSAGHPILAAITNTTVGTLTLLSIALIFIRPRLPGGSELAQAPWWAWFGGMLGSCYLLNNTMLAPRLGSASLTACLLCGEILTALALDHFGLVGFERRPINLPRLLGAGLLVAGVLIVRRY